MLFGCCVSSGVASRSTLYRTVSDIPSSMFETQASITGTVLSVPHGDTLRVRHRPAIRLPGHKMIGVNSQETLKVKLYAIDSPEISYFGAMPRPYSKEAREFTKKALEGKTIKIRLLRKDQYDRAVAVVHYGPKDDRKDLSEELLKRGLAVVYRLKEAEFDGKKESFAEMEKHAKKIGVGLWGCPFEETPWQYKARLAREKREYCGY